MDYDFDIGSFHRKITTDSADAQLWFDRGLTWCYGFNHGEGQKCFEKALEADPQCPMAYWGLAFSLGPNYNKAYRMFDKKNLEQCVERGYKALKRAEMLVDKASPVESKLIHALGARFPQDSPSDDLFAWSLAYANAMEVVYNEFTEDLDVATLYGDSLMCLTPWALWDTRTGKPAKGSRVVEARAVFDHAFKQKASETHPGLLHMFVHLIEMSTTPELGLKAADRLRGLCPDVGHLEHMPTHLDVLVGEYRTAISSNASAVRADQKFSAKNGIMNFYSMYRMHSFQSLIYAAMLAGQSEVALDACTQMESTLPKELLLIESPPMADWLEGFQAVRMHVLVRFGRWKDILELKFPEDQKLYCVTTAMTHYARTQAFAATGRIDEADNERSLLRAAVKHVPDSRLDFPNRYIDILGVALAMADGELEYRRQNFDAAWKHLRAAVELDDNLVYSEPWGWTVPTRHALGALLLEQGYVQEALEAYAADLGFDTSLPPGHRHPNNIFALHGYNECLRRLGRTTEAKLLEQEIRRRQAVADIPVKSSCFCRLETEVEAKATNGSNGTHA